jgi:hypothetical protein
LWQPLHWWNASSCKNRGSEVSIVFCTINYFTERKYYYFFQDGDDSKNKRMPSSLFRLRDRFI